MKKGFTLIEILLYLGLTGFLISGLILSSYELLSDSGSLQDKVLILDQNLQSYQGNVRQGGFFALMSTILLAGVLLVSVLSLQYVVIAHEQNVDTLFSRTMSRDAAYSCLDMVTASFFNDSQYAPTTSGPYFLDQDSSCVITSVSSSTIKVKGLYKKFPASLTANGTLLSGGFYMFSLTYF